LIICTQPRRIAAISLAKRVAEELNEPIGRSVGFMIGADRVVGQHTRVRFVTTGWAMEKLLHSNYLEEITHLVLDEVHERSIDADLLHLVIKLVLPKVKTIGCFIIPLNLNLLQIPAAKRPKIVLMSATFNAGIFSEYYCPSDPPKVKKCQSC
jgi:HrpA-like RNA helicase